MKQIAAVIHAIEQARGNDKLVLLDRYKDLQGLKETLRFIYNPYCKTGIRAAKLARGYHHGYSKDISLQDAIEYFSLHQTGSAADVHYAWLFINSCKQDNIGWLAKAVVTQELKIGVTATSLNKVYGSDFIPKVGCMLGTLFGDVAPGRVHWPCIVTEKLDGIRRILIKENGVCRFYSRSGHEDTGLFQIMEEAAHLPDNFVYDGELLAKGEFKDCIAQRQATNSIANSKGLKSGLTFNVFDMVPVDEFYRGRSSQTAIVRKVRLGATFMDEGIQHLIPDDWAKTIAAFGLYTDLQYIKVVPVLGLVRSLSEAEPIVNSIWTRGGEGIMLNASSGLYEIKRSKDLLKVKHTEEYTLEVVGLVEGTGKYEDSCGAIIVLYTDKSGVGRYVKVGSGFTDDQRYDLWNNQDKYFGRFAEIETFGESINAAGQRSLNCPIFKRFVGDE